VKVGSAAHPMEEKHYIEWIEMIADSKVCQQFLKPGQAPEAVFPVKDAAMTARAYWVHIDVIREMSVQT